MPSMDLINRPNSSNRREVGFFSFGEQRLPRLARSVQGRWRSAL